MRRWCETRRDALIWGAVGTVAVLGLVIRLSGLDRESLWLDEAGRVAIAALPLGEILHAVEVVELSPPLYHLILRAWMSVAGYGDYAVRLFSALLILPTVPLAFVLGRALAGSVVGIVFAVLVALNPSAVHYGQEAAMYALLLPLSLLVTRAGLGILAGDRHSRPRWLLIYVVSGSLALYTHYYAGLLLLSTCLVGLTCFMARRSKHGIVLWLAAHLVIGLAFLPWARVFLAQAGLAASVEEWSGITVWEALARWAGFLLADGQGFWGAAPGVAFVCAGVALGCWRLLGGGQPRSQGELPFRAGAMLMLALTLVPLVIAIVAAGPLHSFRERGFLAVAAGPWLLVAASMVGGPFRGRLDSLARVVLGLGVVVATIMGLLHHFDERKEEWRYAAGLVGYEAQPDDPIIFIHFGGQLAFDRYFDGPQPRMGLPDSFSWATGYTAPYRVTPQDVERVAGPALEGRQRAWVVLSHDAGRGSEHLLAYLDRRMRRLADISNLGVRVILYRVWLPGEQELGEQGVRRSDCANLPDAICLGIFRRTELDMREQ